MNEMVRFDLTMLAYLIVCVHRVMKIQEASNRTLTQYGLDKQLCIRGLG